MTLTPRTIIILSIFFAVLIVVTTFILLYRDQTDKLLDLYVAKITTCGNITDEQVCFDKSFCKGIYGPSCPGCTDSVFLECKKLTSSDQARLATQQNLCLKTAGLWQTGLKGSQCACSTGLTFNQLTGCQLR